MDFLFCDRPYNGSRQSNTGNPSQDELGTADIGDLHKLEEKSIKLADYEQLCCSML